MHMLTNEKIDSLELNVMQKNLIKGLMENRKEEMKRYSDLTDLIKKAFGSRTKIKEIHTISEDIYVIEQPNPFKKEESDSDSFFEVLVDGKKAPMGTLSLDGAIILAICFKNGETDFSKYAFKVLNIE